MHPSGSCHQVEPYARPAGPGSEPEPTPYWQIEDVVLNGARTPLDGSYSELCDQVEHCLGNAVRSQMLSDVPLGCFLSGGVNSSLVTALMRQNSNYVRSFSIGFEAKQFNEASHAREVATHLGTRHTEFVVTEADALAVVPELPRIYDEPFANSSQVPVTLLARLARRGVTVALTGNGADEIFGGYNRHVLMPKVWRALWPLPSSGRRGLGHVFELLQRAVAGERNALHRVTRRLGLPLTTLDKLGQVGGAIAGARTSSDFYRAMVSTVPESARLVLRPGGAAALPAMEGVELAEWTMAMDTLDYLPWRRPC